ncbi:MAG: transcriptional activator NhaR [Myxococcales bacterium]
MRTVDPPAGRSPEAPVDWLNYHHLYYFWVVAREGGIARASPVLYLAPPTLSAQIKRLEESLGETLFDRVGRRLELTEMGKVVYRFANEIFSLGHEMVETVKGRPTGRPLRLVAGVADVVPKGLVRRLLEPARQLPGKVRIVVREDPYDRLLAHLASQDVDVVIADAPVGPGSRVRAFNHLLGSSAVCFFAAPGLAKSLRQPFPRCLDGAPMLLPTENTQVRRPLEQWFARHGLQLDVVGEFEDAAMMRSFGESGAGVFVGPAVMAEEICEHRRAKQLGQATGVAESFYGIVIERRVQSAAVQALLTNARHVLLPERRA